MQNKRESEENPGAPPGCLGENRARLADPDERVRRGAGAAKVRSEAAALACLQQNRGDEHYRVYDQNYEKKIVKHFGEYEGGLQRSDIVVQSNHPIDYATTAIMERRNHNCLNNNRADLNGFGGYCRSSWELRNDGEKTSTVVAVNPKEVPYYPPNPF